MKAIVINRLKKWTLLALMGCSAYFVGYYYGNRQTINESRFSSSAPNPKVPIKLELKSESVTQSNTTDKSREKAKDKTRL